QHLMFNLDDLALDAAARGLGVAMTDRMLAHDALARGDLVVPFGEPLRTGAFYAFWLPDKGAPHPAAAAVLAWFQEQLEHTHAAQQR
ncbi:TPA: LysR substrate-binding domain-containing protein, partial [Klebsiella pneumoniae]